MIKLKNILTEKKDLAPNLVKQLAKMTDANNHTEVRKALASLMGDKQLMKAYDSIITLQDFLGRANESNAVRNAVDKNLFKKAKMTYSNYKDIESAF